MEDFKGSISDREIISFLSGFTKLILTDKDCFNKEEVDTYISDINSDNERIIANLDVSDEKRIHSFLFVIITEYLDKYVPSQDSQELNGTPFAFDTAGNYQQLKMYFEQKYCKSSSTQKLPYIFTCTFDYIQSVKEHFAIFLKFYSFRSQEKIDEILSSVKTEARKIAENSAENYVQNALKNLDEHTKNAEIQAKVASQQAEIASQNARDASRVAVENAVSNKMAEITSHISETSVTILGIFSGIVLTVVAGLFYSSSVLENINSASLFRLICIASLVGLVCYHLIALMFRSIDKIKNKTKLSRLGVLDVAISLILTVLVILFGVLQLIFP